MMTEPYAKLLPAQPLPTYKYATEGAGKFNICFLIFFFQILINVTK